MSKKGYLFWDSETANSKQLICQAAYCLTDFDGKPLGEPVASYVDPQSDFNPYNIRVHGIRPEDIVGAPTFAEFWASKHLDDLMADYVFVAHNAKSADLHHIRKSLAACGVAFPEIEFVDTMQIALSRGLPGGIGELCEALGVQLMLHHDAASDAIACRDVFWELGGRDVEPEIYVSGKGGPRGRARHFSGLGLVNKSEKTIEEVLEEFEARGLRGNPLEIETLEGLRVVVTGEVPGYDRVKFKAALKDAGAKATGAVSAKTQYVAIGDNAGQTKIDAAVELNKPVITVGELLDVLNR